jgi:1-acyl-sn-glycerol-3-phosphate acyltransferase
MNLFYRTVYLLAKGFFRFFFGLRVYGIEHVQKGPALIVANHCSFYDPPVLSISCPEEVRFLAKESLFKIPGFGFFIRALNAHPVKGGATNTHTFRKILQWLSQGKKVIIFPEGKRSKDGQIGAFEKGFVFLVQKSNCKVIPAYIDGTFEVWPVWKKWPKPFGKISVVFGPAIYLDSQLEEKKAQEKLIQEAEQEVRRLKKYLRPR